MDQNEVIKHAERYRKQMEKLAKATEVKSYGPGKPMASGSKAEISQFLAKYAGPKSSFYKEASTVSGIENFQFKRLASILTSFISYVHAGLAEGISPERRAQLDVVSDFLDFAQRLLEDSKAHPAAAAMIVGATLEEFLRTWVESIPLSLPGRKPGIQAYADALRAAEVISRQDLKDVNSWAGIRNHAAHGDWNEVSDRQRIKLMLEGVNLFMRRYGI